MLIGVIIGSTRQPRACPQIAQFIVDTIRSSNDYRSLAQKPVLKLIDLASWNLPMYDESHVPSLIEHYSDYDHEHTKLWSQEVQKCDGFIFVTPQYNWGYPAALKNAIDYLFNEWKGKPAVVATYGGHGGSKCNEQLTVVLNGLRMKPTESKILLSFPDRETFTKAAQGIDLCLSTSSTECIWEADKVQVETAFAELAKLLLETPSTK
ncbi:LANO_0G06172g1_1 [Lachancea nothofagi CBS 11611]|uniref:LANO_0G06172g1_1 n=1 Tax=Lachancea nothofagi CBS 11611 TaxID=1266666 RepID=A0A1G4KGY7_9SACH|nr:LANO_0G06172g1_1 [Lachancea nothofagi CBS 11611]